jgi:hypothetical protein
MCTAEVHMLEVFRNQNSALHERMETFLIQCSS